MSDITMQQIADAAGVSRATVSRVLFSPDKVREDTRERILRIIRDLGYTYHAGAAELIKRKSFLIGLIIPTGVSIAFNNTILTVQQAANELGMSLMLGCSEFDAVQEKAILDQFMARRMAGIIMIGSAEENEPAIERLQNSGVPVVVIWTSPGNDQLAQIGFDNAAAASTAVQYLVDMGHKKIGLISGPFGGGRRVRARIEGYRATMRENNLPVPDSYIRSAVPSIDNGEREAIHLLDMPDRPTALFCASDMLAIGALSAARKMGIRVPSQLSVVGFDNIQFTEHCEPPLTTVAVPEQEMSRMATHLLKQLISGEVTSRRSVWLETQLIVRKSCAPPHSEK